MYTPGGQSGAVLAFSLFGNTGDPLFSLRGHLRGAGAIALRGSTQELVTAGKDGLILLWQPHNRLQDEVEEDGDDWSNDDDDDAAG